MEQEPLKTMNNEKEENKPRAISFWQLQYSYLEGCDYVIILIACLGSLAVGVSMPLFSTTFGGSINTFGAAPMSNDQVLTEAQQKGLDTFIEGIRTMCLNFLFIGIGMGFAGFIMIWLWSSLGRKIAQRIKKNYFKVLMSQEQSFFDSNENLLEYPTKIQAQIKKIEMGLGDKVGNTIMAITMALSSYIVGFIYSWKLALVLFSVVPLIIIGGIVLIFLMRGAGNADSKAYAKAGGIAEENLKNIKTIASFSNYDYEIERYTKNTETSLKESLKFGMYNAITLAILMFVIFASFSLAIWFGSRMIVEKEYNEREKRNFAAGDVLIVLFTVVFGSFSVGQTAPNISAISEAMTEAYEFFELKKRVPRIDLSKSTIKPDPSTIKGEIEFKNVSFSYPNRKTLQQTVLFSDLNFKIEPNTVTALVGKSGSGKTSVIGLIERLYDVDNGELLIDGHNVKTLDLQNFRSMIGYVPQEPVLFNQSVRENIIFGRDGITNQHIWDALKLSYADEFIKTEDDLEFIVGVKGGNLSGGQKQRIAIARAILLKPKILILDEATSALDYESEKIVQKALNKISQGVTTIVVAHRLSTIKNADKIVVLNEGKIIETGTHKSLLELGNIYAELVQNQLGTYNFNEEEVNSIPEEAKALVHNKEVIKRKNSLELLQDKVEEEKRKKAEIEKLASEKKKKLWPFLMKHCSTVVFAAFFACCAGACWPAYGILLAETISGLSAQDEFFNIDYPKIETSGFLLSMFFLSLAGGSIISYFFQGYLFSKIGENLTNDLRNSTFIKYLSLHIGYFDIPVNSVASLTTKLSSDTTQIKGVAITMVGVTFQTLSTLLMATILGFIYDWRLSLINLSFLPLIMVSSVANMKLQQGFSQVDEVVDASAGGIVSESISNTRTIFCFNMQDKVVELYNKEITNGMKTINKTSFVNGILFGFSQFFMFATYSVLFFAGGSFMYQRTLELQNMFKAIFVLLMAGFGLGQTQQYVGDVGKSNAALANLYATIDEPSTIDPLEIRKKDPPAVRPNSLRGKIEFRNVTFAYPSKPDKNVLKDVSFIILPGQKAAFAGYSGSGKSTIVQLIERFYDTNSGQIFIDDVEIKEYDLISLRSYISMVMQEPVLFNRSNSENVKYGKLNATDQEIQNAVERSNIADKITPRENNNPPSGGQKQKLAIARAIIKNPAILLLDEATSALDAKSEIEVQKTLDSVMEQRTTVTIAHKLSTIENSDIIYFMEKGEIKEFGTHKELLAKKGKYATLANYAHMNVKDL